MSILITGGLGYIGSNVIKKIIEQDLAKKIIIVDNLTTSDFKVFTNLTNIRCNLKSKIELHLIIKDIKELNEKFFIEHEIKEVIHFAGSLSVSESVENPMKYYLNNTAYSFNLIDICSKRNIDLIFSSTAAVYKESLNPVTENSELKPMSPYGRSKLFIEEAILDCLSSNKNFNAIILRYFNVAGASKDLRFGQNQDTAHNLINLAVQTALGIRKEIVVYGNDYDTKDGTCIRDFIHIEDLAEAHISALIGIRKNKSGIFNVGSGKGFTVKETLEKIKELNNGLNIKIGKRRPGDLSISTANTEKIEKELGFKIKFSLEDICKSALDWGKKKQKQN